MTNSQNFDGDYYTDDGEDDHQLPGFRFHPTDEELAGFYLRRKVDKKPLRIELIKHIDIYKHDPWDLLKISSTGDNEGYFFCKRGRKYRNSIRPNRVTESGFWKATGIDKPVYSRGGEGHECIGLKKTLVYYCGKAGKGTKTDWMMNEFRLPSKENTTNSQTTMPEAEVWTICRIFKRIVSHKKYTGEWRLQQPSAKRQSPLMELPSSTITYGMGSDNFEEAAYISFENPGSIYHHHHLHSDKLMKPAAVDQIVDRNQLITVEQISTTTIASSYPQESIASSSSSYPSAYGSCDLHELLLYQNWDELRPIVDFAFDT